METEQPQPAGVEADSDAAAAALAEIQHRQERVIEGALVPFWYWWLWAAGIVAIGAARDSGDSLVQAIVIPLAALGMAGLIGAAIPTVRHRVQVRSDAQTDRRVAVAVFGLIALVNATIIVTAASLAAAHDAYPITIASAAGAVVMVTAGQLLNWYVKRRLLSEARRQMTVAKHAPAHNA